jgi:hypothetical protein
MENNKNKIRLIWRMKIVLQKICNQKLPPMREKMMPDVLPSLLTFEKEIHI